MNKRRGSRGCVGTPKRYCRGPARLRRSAWPVAAVTRRRQDNQVSGTFMPQKVRIALDAMGGDVGASVVVPGAAISLARHPDTEFLLVGNRALIEEQLARHPKLKAASRIIHTDVAVSMEDKPSQALRRGRKTSSMWLAIDAVKKGEADVAVSAGNTGALMAMARFHLHMLPGHRPAGDRGGLADAARRFRRARPRRHHRRRCAASGGARDHGRRDGERAAQSRAADGRPAQHRHRGDQGPRGDPRGRRNAARDELCRSSTISASSRATASARAPPTSS